MSALVGNKAIWYLMRGSGVVSLLLLTAVLVLGIVTASRIRSPRISRVLTMGMHRSISLLALAFLAIHIASAVLDRYAAVRIVDVIVPFTAAKRPLFLGLGALSLDLMLAVAITSALRYRLGLRAWRAIHWLGYATWPVALVHGLGIGSDTGTPWMLVVSASSIAAVALALIVRLRAVPAHAAPPVRERRPPRLATGRPSREPGR